MKCKFLSLAAAMAFWWAGILAAGAQQPALPAVDATVANATVANATVANGVTIPVNSPAFLFSPANWTGDKGRGGALYRQTWNPGTYLRVHWSSANAKPTASLLLDTSSYDGTFGPPQLTYNVDGLWTANVPASKEIDIAKLSGAGNHVLTVYFTTSEQRDRWGSAGQSGKNVLRVKGLRVDALAKPQAAVFGSKWLLEIGDSITEGSAAGEGRSDSLSAYSYFVGQAMQTQGFEYGVSACGWSGWLRRGDNPPGDVPAYYAVSGSTNGSGGVYDDGASRWNKLDGNHHTLLDKSGHLSAYGETGQEPSVITINYGTNDDFMKSNVSDVQASITQSLTALRRAAPAAQILVMIPFEQFEVPQLKAGVLAYRRAHPQDRKVSLIDFGRSAGRSLDDNGYWGGVHPNLRGHAVFAARIVAEILVTLPSNPK
jgi:lysophospholipase L1-like esterase